MGRAVWGTTNLASNTVLYGVDFRAMSGGHATNQSQSDMLRSGVDPYLYFGNSGTTNSSYSTYVYNKGYVYGIKLTNDSPSYGTIKVNRSSTLVTSTATPGGSTNDNNQYVSDSYSYIGIVFTVSAGGTFNGWRTSPNGGGSSITTSASYNAYYSDSWIYNYTQWYTYTQAAVTSDSKVMGQGTPAFRACLSFATVTVYYDDNYTALSAPAIYKNSGLTAYANFSNNVSNGTNYRYWNTNSWSGAQAFCGF